MGSSNSYHKSMTSTTGFPPYSEAERKLNSEFWRWIFFCYVLGKQARSHSRGQWNSLRWGWSKPKSWSWIKSFSLGLTEFQVPWSPLSWAFPLPNHKNPPPNKSPAWKCSQRKIQWTNNKFLLCCTVISQQREDIENFQRDFHYRLIRRPSALTALFPLYFLLCTGSFPSNNCNFFWHFLSFFTIRLFSSSAKRQRVSYGLI